MGRNYKNYYKEENKEDVVDTPVVPEENKEDVVDTPVIPEENKDEVKTDNTPVTPEENEDEVKTDSAPVAPEENEEEIVKGVVSNCSRLNVREEASTKSSVLKVIDSGTEVEVLGTLVENQFYKVKIDDIIGFCVKDFIELK